MPPPTTMSTSSFPPEVYMVLKDIAASLKEIAAELRKIQNKMK